MAIKTAVYRRFCDQCGEHYRLDKPAPVFCYECEKGLDPGIIAHIVDEAQLAGNDYEVREHTLVELVQRFHRQVVNLYNGNAKPLAAGESARLLAEVFDLSRGVDEALETIQLGIDNERMAEREREELDAPPGAEM